MTLVVKKNWLRDVCLRLRDTDRVCPQRSSQNGPRCVFGQTGVPPNVFWYFALSKMVVAVLKKWSRSNRTQPVVKKWLLPKIMSKHDQKWSNNGQTVVAAHAQKNGRAKALCFLASPTRLQKSSTKSRRSGRLFVVFLMAAALSKNGRRVSLSSKNDRCVSVCICVKVQLMRRSPSHPVAWSTCHRQPGHPVTRSFQFPDANFTFWSRPHVRFHLGP